MTLYLFLVEGYPAAQLCEFGDGSIAVRWLSETPSTILFNNIDDFCTVHIDSHPDENRALIQLNLMSAS